MKSVLVIFFIIFLSASAYSQQEKIDSLLHVDKTSKPVNDSTTYFRKIKLSKLYIQKDLNQSRAYAEDAYAIAQVLDRPLLIYQSLNQIAITYGIGGEHLKAHEYFLKCVEIDTTGFEPKHLGNTYNNLGISSLSLGNLEDAVSFHLKGLHYREIAKDTGGVASSYNNLALVYYREQNHTKALEYYNKGFEIIIHYKGQNDLKVNLLNNSGLVLNKLEKFEEALSKFYKALEIAEKNELRFSIGHCLQNIGETYVLKNEFEEAKSFFEKALSISEEVGDEYGKILAERNLASIYVHNKDYKPAIIILEKAIDYYSRTGDKLEKQKALFELAQANSGLGNHNKGYEILKEAYLLKDTIFNENSSNAMAEMEAKYELDKQKTEIKLLENQAALDEAEIKKQEADSARKSLYIMFVVVVLIVALIFIVFVIYSLSQKKKDNALILFQKKEVELQKLMVEEKNKEILDSINYAKRIQGAILPSNKLIEEHLPDSFILYKPKDIVAGDFYWIETKGEFVFFAVADCTGHGVPGALVSVVCHNALNRSVKEFGLERPDEILGKTRELVIEQFAKSEEDVKDGMDIALCVLNKANKSVSFAGANNPLWIIRKDKSEINEVKGDKQPIGKYANNHPFTNHQIVLDEGDIIYLFTDGFADQFGGPKGKKFKYRTFKNLLLEGKGLSMKRQKDEINSRFESWRGEVEQLDDVCVIGVKMQWVD